MITHLWRPPGRPQLWGQQCTEKGGRSPIGLMLLGPLLKTNDPSTSTDPAAPGKAPLGKLIRAGGLSQLTFSHTSWRPPKLCPLARQLPFVSKSLLKYHRLRAVSSSASSTPSFHSSLREPSPTPALHCTAPRASHPSDCHSVRPPSLTPTLRPSLPCALHTGLLCPCPLIKRTLPIKRVADALCMDIMI